VATQFDVGEAGEATPHDRVAGRRIARASEIAAKPGDFGQVTGERFLAGRAIGCVRHELVEKSGFRLGQGEAGLGIRSTSRRAQRELARRVLFPEVPSRAATPTRPDPADARENGRIAVSETKNRGLLFPLPDDLPEDRLPEPIELTPEQLAAQAVEEQRDRQRRLDWAVTARCRLRPVRSAAERRSW
jgi:hypothetical protein